MSFPTFKLMPVIVLVMAQANCGRDEHAGQIGVGEAVKQVVLTDGGVSDTLEFQLYRSPTSHAVRFSTYVPADVQVRESSGGGADFVSFVADSAAPRPRANMHVYFFPPNTSERRAHTEVEAFVMSRGVPISEREEVVAPFSEDGIPPEGGAPPTPRFSWALWQGSYAASCALGPEACVVGWVALGRHGDRLFHISIRHAPMDREFLRQRVAVMLREWRWLDTGEPLRRETARTP